MEGFLSEDKYSQICLSMIKTGSRTCSAVKLNSFLHIDTPEFSRTEMSLKRDKSISNTVFKWISLLNSGIPKEAANAIFLLLSLTNLSKYSPCETLANPGLNTWSEPTIKAEKKSFNSSKFFWVVICGVKYIFLFLNSSKSEISLILSSQALKLMFMALYPLSVRYLLSANEVKIAPKL